MNGCKLARSRTAASAAAEAGALRRFAALLLLAALLPAAPAARADGERGGRGGRGGPGQWNDRAHGHNRAYPYPGAGVRVLPAPVRPMFWGGVGYHFHQGIWYAPGVHGYLVVRPPVGIVIGELPPFFTALTIAGVAYLYANGVYYRSHQGGGYEVAPPPPGIETVEPLARPYIYPGQGQSPVQQASDEYECHRWAVTQTGFDPSGAAVGQAAAASPGQPRDYERARAACLEGRGYTLR